MMKLKNIRQENFEGDTPSAEFVFDNGSRRLFPKDIAWGFKSILQDGTGRSQVHAGCLFSDTGDGVTMMVNSDTGTFLTYGNAQFFVNVWRDDP